MTTSSLPPSRRGRRLGAALVAGAVVMLGTFAVVSPASASTITVTNADDSGANSLREAIATAGDGDHPGADTITFGDIGGPIHLVTPLVIDSDLTIVGQGTSVDGDGVTQLFVVGVGVTATIGQVHMYGGYTTDNGGAISVAGTLTLDRADIHDNVAANGGAISVVGDGSVTLTDSTPDDDYMSMNVHDNDATASGGGIYMSGGTLTITDAAFTSNTSGATAAREGGGAISALGASVSILRTSFSSNGTTGDGGALFGDGSATQIASTTFDSNSSSRFGGAIALVGETLSLKGARLTGNFALSGGGALRTYDVAATVAGSVFRNNNGSTGDGGGIEVFTDHAQGSLEVEASTIVGNSQTGSQVHGTSIPSVRMADTIVALAGTGEDFDVTATTFDVHHSLIQDPSAGSSAALSGHANVLGASPQLSFSDGSLRPSSSSPAVDGGDPSFLTTTLDLTTDIRGLPRVSGDAIDMGAVELQHASTATVDLQDDYDTGSSQTDDVTSDPSPVFDITGVGGLTVELYRGEDLVGFRTGDGTVQDPDDVEGELAYTALVYGEVGDPVSSAPLTVTRDHTAPAVPGVPDLDASSDLGTSATDDLTSATTRTFDLSGVESTATVQLSQWTAGPCIPIFIGFCFPSPDIHTAVGSSRVGNGSVTESSQPGTATPAYEAQQTDLAGNASGYSSRRTVTLDFAAPSIPNAPDLRAASDDGASTTDNSTTKTALMFDVTGVDSGATATLARVDGQSADEVDTRTGDGAMTDAGPVPAGTHTYVVSVMDAAGNTSVDPDGLDVTVLAPPAVFVPPSTTTTTAPSPPTTAAPPAAATPATASNPTPVAGETVRLQTAPPAGGNTAGNTAATIDPTKPSTAILLSTNGTADLPMPTPVITKNANGSTSISVQVPPSTPPGVYLIAVVGTTPGGESRVIIVPVVVRRTARATATRAPAVSAVAVPDEVRAIQASVSDVGGEATVATAVLHQGATLSIQGGHLVVDRHAGSGHGSTGTAGLVGLLLAAVALLVLNIRRTRSAR